MGLPRLCLLRSVALLVALVAGVPLGAAPLLEVPLGTATYYRDGKPAALAALHDRFGPGVDGAVLWDRGVAVRDEVRYPCTVLPEGDYVVGLQVSAENYSGFGEVLSPRTMLYRNLNRVVFTAYTEPSRPDSAAEGAPYQSEMLTGKVHVKPGDVFRIMAYSSYYFTVGTLRLYRDTPDVPQVSIGQFDYLGRPEHLWLHARWTDTQRDGDNVTQTCELFNPGNLPITFWLTARAVDWLQSEILTQREQLTLGPGETATRRFTFGLGAGPRTRLTFIARHPDFGPPVRLSRFWVRDVTTGPRPTFSLAGEWERCWVQAVEPGAAPPADATWEKVAAPAYSIVADPHCAWFRRSFDAPEYLRGERILFHSDALPIESWFYLNGQAVGHELHGALPFEVDLTPAFRPGQRNELLIAARDWIAYSPANQERLRDGEPLVFKDGMRDVCDYPDFNGFGLTGPLWLEARPAVSVDDVSLVTSVESRTLTLLYRLRNTGGSDRQVRLGAQVLDRGKGVLEAGRQTVAVPAGGTAAVTLKHEWVSAHLWSPDSPRLYVLETTLDPGAGAPDRHLERFGFRELRQKGIHWLLNGHSTKLRGTCNGETGQHLVHKVPEMERRCQAIFDHQTFMKEERQMQFARAHLGSRSPLAAELADETGLLLQYEGDTHQVKFTLDDVFWKAVEAHSLRLIDAFKNHPSVISWSGGNENMWGGYYQGEAVRTIGNRWQVRIAKAMAEHDPLHRPVNWEADNDLFGGGDSYSTHYPRELSEHPDLPNGAYWGALDGRTVVPNTMGPIALGAKPLSVGETYWPATLNRPFGTTVMNGDASFLDGSFIYQGWIDSCRFLTAGLRDLEPVFICPYYPLHLLHPRELVLKEEVSRFHGGRTVTLHLNVHNDEAQHYFGDELRWSLTARSGKLLDSGQCPLLLDAGSLQRLTLKVRLPRVSVATEATLRVVAQEGRDDEIGATREWRIFPAPKLVAPAALKLALYDPEGATAAMLKRLGVRFAALPELAVPPAGSALLVGRNALKHAGAGGWREALGGFVRGGGKVAILEQDEAPDFLPVPLSLAKAKPATITFRRAADHPLLAGLTDDDLRWWADNHVVSVGNYRKPNQGNWLPLSDAGTTEGMLETPLLEEYDGRGSFVLCQFLLSAKAGLAPPATRLLENLLHYLAAPSAFRAPGNTALLAAPNAPLRAMLDGARLVYDDLTAKPGDLLLEHYRVAVVDAASTLAPAVMPPLRSFAEAGGRVLIHGAAPEQRPELEALLGLHLRFHPMAKEPGDVSNRVLRRGDAGLLAGVSNHDLFWPTGEYLGLIRREGWWWFDCGKRPAAEYIADSFCQPTEADADKCRQLTRPCALLEVPVGKGELVLSQLRLDHAPPDTEPTVSRLRALLLTNLGCTLRSPGGGERARLQRLGKYQFAPLDLAPFANRGLTEDKAAGIVGWSNQGENDLRALPTGRQVLAGVPFQIAAPRSAVALYSQSGAGNDTLPREVKGIPVGRRADSLFFLHTSAYSMTPGSCFRYRIEYADGSRVEVPIAIGREVLDWWDDPVKNADRLAAAGAAVAWRGDNPMREGVTLFCYEWVNPQPAKEIRAVDFGTVPESGYNALPFLLGITAGTLQPADGIVEDVLGTAGVKVRLGTQLEEVYYIGVVGIEPGHPYYGKAVAAHRAMAVGQRVLVVDDVVARNAAGQRVAYVYLGTDASDSRNLLNARVIGDGLGRLGNFEGNNRLRTYLENLGFITQAGKKGMWGP